MNKKIKILLAEDNVNDVKLLEKEFKKENLHYELLSVDNEDDYRKALASFNPDIILSDYSMPVFDGLSALRIRIEVSPLIPFIIVTGSINENTAVECLKAGADDYVIKEHLNRICPSIKSALRTKYLNIEKEKAQKDLVESEKKFRTLIENLAIGVYQIAPDGTILEINPAMRRIIGFDSDEKQIEYSPDMLKNYKSWDFYPDVEVRKKFLENIKQQGEIRNIEMQIFNLKKELIWVSITAKGRFDTEGNLLFIDGVLEDISARKESERQLIEAKEKAEEMNRLKSSFLANMSHELRTPMVGILGFSEILAGELENEDLKNFSKSIYKSGKRLLNTLNLILDLSRIEANKHDLVLMDYDINRISRKIILEYSLLADNKGIYLKSDFKAEELFCNIDERLFRSILGNLVDNAIKYTNDGGVKIILDKEVDLTGRWALIKVQDTGIGIPEEFLKTIFEEFRQVSEGWSRSYEGTGLGLTIAKRFTDLLKGEISVESKLNSGSTFTVRIPLNASKNKIQDYKNDKREIPNEVIKKTGKDFLLIDDDKFVNDIISNIFHNEAYSYANNQDEALVLLGSKQFSLILLDINLGYGVEGIDVLKKIRKLPGYKKIPVVAITAYAMVNDKERFLQAGFDDYISKPFDKKELQNIVFKYIKL